MAASDSVERYILCSRMFIYYNHNDIDFLFNIVTIIVVLVIYPQLLPASPSSGGYITTATIVVVTQILPPSS